MSHAVELNAAPDTGFCVFGKHPAHGDFLSFGVDRLIEQGLTRWLDATLSTVRTRCGGDWAPFWDAAIATRFWIGQAVIGQTLAGVLFPSRDAVGRRYPLIVAVAGSPVPPPVIEPDQTLWDTLQNLPDGGDVRGWMAGAHEALARCPWVAGDETMALAELWARRGDGDAEALLRDAERMDHAHAALSRSYWWQRGGTPGAAASWLGCQGLPDAAALAWCLQGGVGSLADEPTNGASVPETVAAPARNWARRAQ